MQRKKLISKTLTTAVMLALYIGVAQPSITSAQEYTDQITGANDAYAAHGIRTTVGMESTYTFAEGDVVKWTNAYPAVEVWDEGTHLKFTTPLNLQLDVKDGATSGIHAATSNYDTPGRLTAQNVNITGQSTGSNYDINRIYISGIDTYAADIKIENLNIDITADGKPESIADGIFMGRDFDDEDSEHTLTVTGAANIKAVSKNGYYAWAAGIEAQDQAKMNFGKLTIATEAMAENLARTNGIFAAGNSEINAGETHINVKGISPNPDESSYSYGLNAIHSSTITLGDNSTIHAESSGDVKIAQSTTVDAISHMQNATALSWRQEDATLSKRLGDLRQGDGDQGFWVRLNRGEFKYDNAKNQNNFFQMGYDKAGGDWHYGAAISRNSGKTTYGDATAKNRSLALTLYGTWLGDKGHYADIVLKEGRLSNDYDISAPIGFTHGQYKTWGSSISAEYGREIAMGDKAYFTPQAQLSWLRIAGKDYTTANGIAISQDSQSSTIGRLGFELGSRLGDNGNVYAKASVLHDFGGSADTRLSYNGVSTTYSNDLGDTWYEAGIGFNLKAKDNSYLYADVSKAFGGDYKTPWQWNVGMRWTF